MEEGNAFALGAETGVFIDEPDAGSATATENALEVIDGEAHVVNAGPALGDELSNRRVRSLGLQQLDERLSRRETSDPGAVRVVQWYFRQAKDVAIEGQELV